MSHGTCRTRYFQNLLILTINITGASWNLICEFLICEFYRILFSDDEYLFIGTSNGIYEYDFDIITSVDVRCCISKKKPTKFLNKWLVFTLQCLYIQCNEESTVLDPNADPTESLALATTSTLNLTNVTYKPDPGGSCQQCSMESSLEIAHCVAHYTSVTISCVFTIEVSVEICDIMKKKKKNFKNKRNFF